MPGPTMIAPELLETRIGAPDAPVMIDVCIDEDFALDPRLIPGAVRHPFCGVASLAPSLEGQQAIVICQKGLKLSQGGAALLRSHGVAAKALAGGMVAWTAKGLPAIRAPAKPLARIVAAERPGQDALAALWLIRRFACCDTQVLFVSQDAAEAVAGRFDATRISTFRDALDGLGLATAALCRLHRLLQGDAPETPGFMAILAGLRDLHPDDLSYFAASLAVFDALHRACAEVSVCVEEATQ